MSFEDVARRMQQRNAEGMVPTYQEGSLPEVPPDADAITRRMIEAERRAAKTRDLTVGGVLLALGLIITLATYESAASSAGGGTYIIAYGPMIYGAIRLFRGLAA
jgi:hypothetical protein